MKMCSQEGCYSEATVRVSWPGRGWVYYCILDGIKATNVLKLTGALGAVEKNFAGYEDDGSPFIASPENHPTN